MTLKEEVCTHFILGLAFKVEAMHVLTSLKLCQYCTRLFNMSCQEATQGPVNIVIGLARFSERKPNTNIFPRGSPLEMGKIISISPIFRSATTLTCRSSQAVGTPIVQALMG